MKGKDEEPLRTARRVVERVIDRRPVELKKILAGACAAHRKARAAACIGRLRTAAPLPIADSTKRVNLSDN
jgi:hypothetical protein